MHYFLCLTTNIWEQCEGNKIRKERKSVSSQTTNRRGSKVVVSIRRFVLTTMEEGRTHHQLILLVILTTRFLGIRLHRQRMFVQTNYTIYVSLKAIGGIRNFHNSKLNVIYETEFSY